MESANKSSASAAPEAKIYAGGDLSKLVRPYDILCGRSKYCFNNIGNRRFRITISMNVKKYDRITNRSERSKFIHDLARTLKDDVGFRFVRVSKKDGRAELSDDEIRAKIGHALRDLSKAQAGSAAAASMPFLGTAESKKILESSKPPLKEIPVSKPPPKKISVSKPPPKIVTPEPVPRRVTNDFDTDINAKLLALTCPDIRKEAMKDNTTSEVPRAIFCSPQEQGMPPIVEDAIKPSKINSTEQQNPGRKQAPVAAAPSNKSSVDDEDDYCLMPLRFDQPDSNGMLDPIPLDALQDFVDIKMAPKFGSGGGARSMSMPNIYCKSPFAMDHHDIGSVSSVPYNDEVIQTRRSFPISHPDCMSISSADDDHMISLCESVDCLSLDLDTAQV